MQTNHSVINLSDKLSLILSDATYYAKPQRVVDHAACCWNRIDKDYTTRSQNQACMYLADDNGINARKQKQKSQLSQRDSAILPVNEYFAKSLKAIWNYDNDTLE